MLPKIKIWIARESVEFLGFWPLSVEFDQFVTLLSVEFKKTLHFYLWSFFCVTSFSVEFFLRYIFFCGVFFALHLFLWSFFCVTCFSVEFFVRYMFFCRVFCALHVFLWSSKNALHVFLSSFCALHVFLWSPKNALHVFLSSFFCVTCFSVEFFCVTCFSVEFWIFFQNLLQTSKLFRGF